MYRTGFFLHLSLIFRFGCSVFIENGMATGEIFSHRLARFGQVKEVNISAPLVLASPDEYGCSRLNSTLMENKIVLVLRGPIKDPCTFVAKAENVELANSVAMIVGDYKQDSTLLLMVSEDGDPVSIPSAFINYTSSSQLRNLMKKQSDKNETLNISLDKRGEVKYVAHTSLALILLLLILPTLWFLIAVGYIFKKWYQRRQLRLRREQRTQMIPLVSYSNNRETDTPNPSNDNSDPTVIHNESCAICLEEFKEGVDVKLLQCNHAFHQLCIDPWLQARSELCPICKQSIFAVL